MPNTVLAVWITSSLGRFQWQWINLARTEEQNGNSGCLFCNDQTKEQNDSSVKAYLYVTGRNYTSLWRSWKFLHGVFKPELAFN